MVKSTLSYGTIGYIVLAAICYSGWNLVARKAGVNQYVLILAVCITTLLPILLYAGPKAMQSSVSTQAMCILIIAGIINGFGFIFYGQALGNQMTDLSVLLPILFGVMVLFSFFGGVWFFNDPMNTSKLFGVMLIVMGIYLINQ